MINKYLKSLLADNKRVIIPDFGGFVVKRSAAGDIISFNSFLKFNDNLLVNIMVLEEGLEKSQALKQIMMDVKDINISLDDKGKYEIEEVGFLIKDKKGNVRFVEQIDDVVTSVLPKEKGEIKKKKQQAVEEAVSSTEQVDTPVDVVEDVSQDIPVEDNSSSMASEEENVEKKKRGKFWIVVVILLIAIGAWSLNYYVFSKHADKETIELVGGTETTESLTTQLADQHSSIIEKKANDQMNVKVSSGDKGFFAKIIDFFKRLFSKKEKPIVAEMNVEDGFTEKSVMQPNQVDTVSGIIVVADKLISPEGEESYNVIIGAFSESKNAAQYNAELIEAGYASMIFERYNGFEAVSMGAYPSLDIALKVCGEELKNTPDVWILVK